MIITNYTKPLTISLLLLLNGCSFVRSAPSCPVPTMPEWVMESMPLESNLTEELLRALQE